MIAKLKSEFKSDKNKKLISNFSYLSLINIANKILPIVVVPYIVHIVGIEKFGVITFAFAFVSYFMLIPQYSFNLTGTKYVSFHREDREKISQNFWTIMMTKLLLLLLVTLLFLALLFSFEKFYAEKEVFLYTFVYLVANTLMPLWFLTGVEEMKYIAIFNIVAKMAYTLLVFLFVKVEGDYLIIPLFNSLTFLLVSLYALYFVQKRFKLIFYRPKLEDILAQLREGKDIFLSNMSVSFYTTINIILLGIFSTYTAVGIYNLAQSLHNAYVSIIKNYPKVIYPHLARYVNEMPLLYREARKFFLFYLGILMVASLFLFVISEFIITLLYGEGHEESILILQILAIATLLEPIGGFFTPYLSLKSEYKTIRNISFKIMILNLIIAVPMIVLFDAPSLAYLLIILSLVQVYLNLSHNREIFRREER